MSLQQAIIQAKLHSTQYPGTHLPRALALWQPLDLASSELVIVPGVPVLGSNWSVLAPSELKSSSSRRRTPPHRTSGPSHHAPVTRRLSPVTCHIVPQYTVGRPTAGVPTTHGLVSFVVDIRFKRGIAAPS